MQNKTKTYNDSYLLIQTFIEINTQLSYLTKRISSKRFLELGDDPKLVQDIERDLLMLYSKARSLEQHFNLEIAPLRKVNIYLSLIKQINDALRFLHDIRKKDFGSSRHTQQLLGKLRNCSDRLYAIGELITTNTGVIH